jgi:hypothetical protein
MVTIADLHQFSGAKHEPTLSCQMQHFGELSFHFFQALNQQTTQMSKMRPHAYKCQERCGPESNSVSVHNNAKGRHRVLSKIGPNSQIGKYQHASMRKE